MSHLALEIFFISLLVVAGLSMAWFAGLVVWRLSAAADGDRELARRVSETFFADMEGSLRELGTSDIAVPKKMKKLASAFYGRLQAYAEAPDEDALVRAIERNVHGGVAHPPVPTGPLLDNPPPGLRAYLG